MITLLYIIVGGDIEDIWFTGIIDIILLGTLLGLWFRDVL